tara:strand:- start:211 stop:384 length:174 start_codon:yes stop_codon:yes gene_type:complete
MNNYQALVQGLYLSVTAPTEEKSKECLEIAKSIADKLNTDDVEKAKLEVEKLFKKTD